MADFLNADSQIIWSEVPNGQICSFADDKAYEETTLDLFAHFHNIRGIDSLGYAMRAIEGGTDKHLTQVRNFFDNPVEFVETNKFRPDLRGLRLTHEMVTECLRKHPNCLEGAVLYGSILSLDNLSGVSLQGARGLNLQCSGGENINFSGACLVSADISNVRNGIFCGANLEDSRITDVPGADFRPLGSTLTVLDRASLAGNFREVQFGDTDRSTVSVLAYSSSIVPESSRRPILQTDDPVLLEKMQAELAEKKRRDDLLAR